MVPEHAGLMGKPWATLGVTSGNRSWFRIYLSSKGLQKLACCNLGVSCSKTGRDLFRRHFVSIQKRAIRHIGS